MNASLSGNFFCAFISVLLWTSPTIQLSGFSCVYSFSNRVFTSAFLPLPPSAWRAPPFGVSWSVHHLALKSAALELAPRSMEINEQINSWLKLNTHIYHQSRKLKNRKLIEWKPCRKKTGCQSKVGQQGLCLQVFSRGGFWPSPEKQMSVPTITLLKSWF